MKKIALLICLIFIVSFINAKEKEIKFSREDDRVNLYQHDAISFGLFEIMADSFKDALQDQTRYYFETKDTKMSYPGPFVRFDFKAVSIDLNDDGIEEVIAYMFGPDHCGSGGCVSYILQNMEVSERDYDGTEVIAEDWKIIGSPFPGDIIFISSNKTNGYFDISHSSGWDEKYSCKFKNGRYVRDSNPKVQC
jgi:hypothetical protein